ncbi:hypothetical protein BLA60_21435 [Actinophytocola xinjiangensis]|uniref:Uncharacterized protein n=1 Tax=Actinophytocola xinjiangensis TaxID=485602 RepID=A0A7Z0WKT3_9PSEU|nr:hypothetical protein BLA60_21435 [Actinophytocola xinjiangensis]
MTNDLPAMALIADLATASQQLAVYVLRVLDAQAGRAEPPSPVTEQVLAARLVELGNALRPRVGCASSRRSSESWTPWVESRAAIYSVDA